MSLSQFIFVFGVQHRAIVLVFEKTHLFGIEVASDHALDRGLNLEETAHVLHFLLALLTFVNQTFQAILVRSSAEIETAENEHELLTK